MTNLPPVCVRCSIQLLREDPGCEDPELGRPCCIHCCIAVPHDHAPPEAR